jgi:hypothetical protein
MQKLTGSVGSEPKAPKDVNDVRAAFTVTQYEIEIFRPVDPLGIEDGSATAAQDCLYICSFEGRTDCKSYFNER